VSPPIATADRQALYGYALKLTRDRTRADDLVQDAMVRALRFGRSYRPGANVETWLRTIMRNSFIDSWHRDRRASSLLDALQPLPDSPSLDFDPELIAAAIAKLPDDHRIAVTLRDLDGLTYAEIAEQTGAPIGTVMSRIQRGRTRLHALLLEHAVELGLVDATSPSARPRFRH
jgi:RNA polymerase sigma-70 factor (ECF subfamily)